MFDITPIVQCVIIVLVILGTVYGLPILKLFKVLRYVKIAVEAAEQLFPESGMGKEKKNYVLEWLNDRGITYDAGMINAMIESAVYKLNQEQDGKIVYAGYPVDYYYGETEGGEPDEAAPAEEDLPFENSSSTEE